MSDALRSGLATLHRRTLRAVADARRLMLVWPQRENPDWRPPFAARQRRAYLSFSSARRWLTPELTRCLVAARTPPGGIPGVQPAVTTHAAALEVVESVQFTFDPLCGPPHADPLPPASWQELVARLEREFTLAVATLPADSRTPDPVRPAAGVPDPRPPRPNWDERARTLSFRDWRHRYTRRAKSQEEVLAAFQAADWSDRVTEGLPDHLSGIVRNLNATLGEGCPLRFEMDGTSAGVRWCLRASSTEVS